MIVMLGMIRLSTNASTPAGSRTPTKPRWSDTRAHAPIDRCACGATRATGRIPSTSWITGTRLATLRSCTKALRGCAKSGRRAAVSLKRQGSGARNRALTYARPLFLDLPGGRVIWLEVDDKVFSQDCASGYPSPSVYQMVTAKRSALASTVTGRTS